MERTKYTPKYLKQRPPVDLDLELPVDPEFRSFPPKGTWEAGYRLSLMGLAMVKDRPWIWEEREQRRCYEEFKM